MEALVMPDADEIDVPPDLAGGRLRQALHNGFLADRQPAGMVGEQEPASARLFETP
jgi:hypothetical protein